MEVLDYLNNDEKVRLSAARCKFIEKYKTSGESYFQSIGGRVMLFSNLEFKDGKIKRLIFYSKEHLILGFDDGTEENSTNIKVSIICEMERPD